MTAAADPGHLAPIFRIAVQSAGGIHLRVAAAMVQMTRHHGISFSAYRYVPADQPGADSGPPASTVLGLITLGITQGRNLYVRFHGHPAQIDGYLAEHARQFPDLPITAVPPIKAPHLVDSRKST